MFRKPRYQNYEKLKEEIGIDLYKLNPGVDFVEYSYEPRLGIVTKDSIEKVGRFQRVHIKYARNKSGIITTPKTVILDESYVKIKNVLRNGELHQHKTCKVTLDRLLSIKKV